jgi:excisionase family DNA binding protein
VGIMAEDRWLSLDDISLHLGVKKDTVYKWLAAKKIPAHKVGRLWKFSKPEIDTWVKSGKASSQGEN